MSYFWALVVIVFLVRIGWSAHGLFIDWRRKRNATWVTVKIANGVTVRARVEDVDWDKLFGYEDLHPRP